MPPQKTAPKRRKRKKSDDKILQGTVLHHKMPSNKANVIYFKLHYNDLHYYACCFTCFTFPIPYKMWNRIEGMYVDLYKNRNNKKM